MTFRVVLGVLGSFLQILLEILLNGNEQNNCNNFLLTFLHCKEFGEDSKACVVDTHLWAENCFFSVFCMLIIIKTLWFSHFSVIWSLCARVNHVVFFVLTPSQKVVYLCFGDKKLVTTRQTIKFSIETCSLVNVRVRFGFRHVVIWPR